MSEESGTIRQMGRTGSVFFGICAAVATLTALVTPIQQVPIAWAAATSSTSGSPASVADLQNQIDAHTQEIQLLTQEIAQYEAAIQKAGTDKRTLQAAINTLDLQRKKTQTQISATQNQIDTIQLQIRQIGSSIANTQSVIATDQAAIGESLRLMQQEDARPFILQLFSSNSFSQAWQDVNQAAQLQIAIKQKMQELHGQESQLVSTQTVSQQKKASLVSQRTTLSSQQSSLVQTKRAKTQLLAETSAKQSNYEKLLAQAKAELSSFSAFTQNAGGSGILGNQTKCDAWGCYYNQRDAAWGNDPLNGTNYTLKSDGCLITSMAMVLTHYGYRNVTPVTINSNPSNFAVYYPAYLLFTISVDGVTATRQKIATIDSTLAQGNPVIVGLDAYGGTHYVVLVSGSHGRYLMRDPYIPNGDDVSFNAHYTMRQIFGIDKVIVNG